MIKQLLEGFVLWGCIAIASHVLAMILSCVSGEAWRPLLKFLYACAYTVVFLAACASGTNMTSLVQLVPAAVCLVVHMVLVDDSPSESIEGTPSSEMKGPKQYPGL